MAVDFENVELILVILMAIFLVVLIFLICCISRVFARHTNPLAAKGRRGYQEFPRTYLDTAGEVTTTRHRFENNPGFVHSVPAYPAPPSYHANDPGTIVVPGQTYGGVFTTPTSAVPYASEPVTYAAVVTDRHILL